ncbi:MAG: molybdopterin-guanine dinucleotide biosynthesis protein MobB, partial [Myxococcales bacterium]|nr:molybdopterin-guanine dinucleotide biosynthesis protein MobB [Myxococcales bacterium]
GLASPETEVHFARNGARGLLLSRRGGRWLTGPVDVDRPGKDSWRHRKAGASVVALVTPTRVCVVHELGEQPQPTLIEVCRSLGPCDVVLVEGWRDGDHPRLEVAEGQVTPRVGRDGGPWSRDDLDAIADFVDAWVEDDRESQGACGA